jgi:hypothetical protein
MPLSCACFSNHAVDTIPAIARPSLQVYYIMEIAEKIDSSATSADRPHTCGTRNHQTPTDHATRARWGVTLFLDLLLIPRWGIAGASLASTVAYTVSAGIGLSSTTAK